MKKKQFPQYNNDCDSILFDKQTKQELKVNPYYNFQITPDPFRVDTITGDSASIDIMCGNDPEQNCLYDMKQTLYFYCNYVIGDQWPLHQMVNLRFTYINKCSFPQNFDLLTICLSNLNYTFSVIWIETTILKGIVLTILIMYGQ